MSKLEIYEKLKDIQHLVWKNDDLMDQGTLFELQDELIHLVLQVAVDCHKENDLIKSFPFLYSR